MLHRTVPLLFVLLVAGASQASGADLPGSLGASSLGMADEGAPSPEAGESTPQKGGNGRVRSLFDRIEWWGGGFLSLMLPLGSTADTGVGIEFAGQGIAKVDLLPGKDFPLPAIIPFRVEFKYAGGSDRYFNPVTGWKKTDVASVLFLFKADFGVNLLWKMEKMWLYPFVGIGMGIENTSGSNINYSGTDLVFCLQFGAAFAFHLDEQIFFFGRLEYCVNAGADNIHSNISFGVGAGLKLT